jgi:hypothetical protein
VVGSGIAVAVDVGDGTDTVVVGAIAVIGVNSGGGLCDAETPVVQAPRSIANAVQPTTRRNRFQCI